MNDGTITQITTQKDARNTSRPYVVRWRVWDEAASRSRSKCKSFDNISSRNSYAALLRKSMDEQSGGTADGEIKEGVWFDEAAEIPISLPKPDGLIGELVRALEPYLKAKVDTAQLVEAVREECEKLKTDVGEYVDRAVAEKVRRVKVELPDLPEHTIEHAHIAFEKVLKLAAMRRNVYLVGPSGSGKTTLARQVAESMGLEFYPMPVGKHTSKHDLMGYTFGTDYIRTPVRDAYEKGGILLLDEIDAGNPGTMTVINGLIENGHVCFPDNKRIVRHKDFTLLVAANTYGRGADRVYVGRNQLDAATLDRFFFVPVDYDESLERALAGNDEWTTKVQTWRRKAFDIKARIPITPRASINGAKLLASGMSEKEVAFGEIWRGMDESLVRKIKGGAS